MVCGMGGSAIGGDLAAVAFGSRLSRPLDTVRSYELPSSMLPDRAVLCSSYSGDTEETIACYEAAEALGARRIVATNGGELAAAARRDGVPGDRAPGGPPASRCSRLPVHRCRRGRCAGRSGTRRSGPRSTARQPTCGRPATRSGELAAELAERLEGSIPVIYGADLTVPVAVRWKTQVNENAKLPAFAAELPEADHNEIAGWEGAGEAGRLSAVFLEDRDQHPRVRQRFELTAKLVEGDAAAVARVETEGESRTERLLWAVMLGDLLSLHLAARRGVDPSPVEVIERLKDELGRPE